MMSGVLLEFYILHVYAKIEIIRKTIITSHSQSRFLTDTYEIGLRPCDVQGKGKGDEWIGCHAADVRLYQQHDRNIIGIKHFIRFCSFHSQFTISISADEWNGWESQSHDKTALFQYYSLVKWPLRRIRRVPRAEAYNSAY